MLAFHHLGSDPFPDSLYCSEVDDFFKRVRHGAQSEIEGRLTRAGITNGGTSSVLQVADEIDIGMPTFGPTPVQQPEALRR
ncbi:hypothetical protein B7R54_10400 [Subtercola boreus]|uniref:Uncharacterized protein n=1 Tax=Subtercola boreus TaxID=120213 RepID=A0A3E0VI09_9MICO|nr:hypothetical protein B7R54_10400 [Subtercola boreus]